MKFAVAGLNHRTAPVEVREKLALRPDSIPGELDRLRGYPEFQEAMILSTCNRVEVAFTVDDSTDAFGCAARFFSLSEDMLPHAFIYEGRDAIRHLFRVASSLDSMVVGEPQILGQLKAAYQIAKDQGAVSGMLDQVLTSAFSVAKRIRTETEIGENAVSVSYAAVELAREIFGSLRDTKVLLVGAGKMSELAAKHLHRSGAEHIYVTNRTYDRSVEMARLFKGWILDYQTFRQSLPLADIVITSSGADGYVLSVEDIQRAIRARRNRPMFLVDIAVPRNVDPEVNRLDNVFLYDIDDLQAVVEKNAAERKVAAEAAERIVDDEVARLEERLKVREAAPAIVSLQTTFERIRAGEIERARARLGKLTPAQEEAVEALTRGIINKIAHGPIAEMRRQAVAAESLPVVETIRRIFRLGDR